jgi:hypothetical protein
MARRRANRTPQEKAKPPRRKAKVTKWGRSRRKDDEKVTTSSDARAAGEQPQQQQKQVKRGRPRRRPDNDAVVQSPDPIESSENSIHAGWKSKAKVTRRGRRRKDEKATTSDARAAVEQQQQNKVKRRRPRQQQPDSDEVVQSPDPIESSENSIHAGWKSKAKVTKRGRRRKDDKATTSNGARVAVKQQQQKKKQQVKQRRPRRRRPDDDAVVKSPDPIESSENSIHAGWKKHLGGLIRWYVNTQDDKAAAEHEVEQMYTNNKCSIEGTK